MAVPKSSITTPVAKSLIQRPRKVSEGNIDLVRGSTYRIRDFITNVATFDISGSFSFGDDSVNRIGMGYAAPLKGYVLSLRYDDNVIYSNVNKNATWISGQFPEEDFNKILSVNENLEVPDNFLYVFELVSLPEPEPANTFSFGNLPIANMFFGSQQVKKVYLGNALVWEKETTLISFTIRGTSYQAEEGMTWGEWVASEYNTDGFVVNGTVIFPPTSIQMYVVYHGVAVSTSEGIVAERAYTTGIEN